MGSQKLIEQLPWPLHTFFGYLSARISFLEVSGKSSSDLQGIGILKKINLSGKPTLSLRYHCLLTAGVRAVWQTRLQEDFSYPHQDWLHCSPVPPTTAVQDGHKKQQSLGVLENKSGPEL